MMLTARPAATKGRAASSAASHSSRSPAAAGPCGLPRPQHAQPASGASSMQRKSSMDTGMQRQFSGSCGSIGLSRRASAAPPQALGTVAEAAEAAAGHHKLLGLFTDPGAASASFDEVCEVLGDVAKLDSVSAALNPSTLGAGQQVIKSLFGGFVGSNAAVSWGMEKVAQNLHNLLGFSLLEGLIDKSLIDVFQQMYGVLDLSGDIGSVPALRLGVAAVVALAVRQSVVRYQAAHPKKLERQLSPAASLSDALAEAAAAALIAESVQQEDDVAPLRHQSLQLQPALSGAAPCGSSSGFSAFASWAPAAAADTSSSSRAPVSFQDLSSSMLRQEGLSRADKARFAVRSAAVSLLLGQFKRANKLKRKFRNSAQEMLQGRLSPALLLALIEAGVLVHNYSELASGVNTLLGMGS